MLGKGENRKYMACIGNFVAFLEACIETDQKYVIYNCINTPNLKMNELVSQVPTNLKTKGGVDQTLPSKVVSPNPKMEILYTE